MSELPIYHRCEGRSEEWFLRRLGIPTASEFHRLITPGGKLSAQSIDYAHVLLAEAMLGKPWDTPETAWMTRGQELEDQAIQAYEFESGLDTQPGGFVTDARGRYGCSPDRLVGDDGVLEIKCPAPNTHVGYLLSGDMEDKKKPQVQGQLLVTGRAWVDLTSYHPELPPCIVRVKRDEEYIAKLRVVLEAFCETLILVRTKLEAAYGPFPRIVLPADRPAPPDTLGVSDEDVEAILEARKE